MSLPPHARSPAPHDSEQPRPGSRRFDAGREAWSGMVPSVIVALTLACLLVVPALFQRQIDATWEEIAYVAEPARAMLLDTKRALAREMAAMRAYVLTEDPRYLATYQEVLVEERVALDAMRPLAIRLGGDVARQYVEFEAAIERWHDRRTEAEFLAGVLDPAEYLERVPEEQALWERMLVAGDRLRADLDAAHASLRADLLSLERWRGTLTLLLVALGLLAAASATFLGWRNWTLRLQSEEAHRELQEVVDDRARLIRGITHDLKNPLGAVQGYAELLHDGILGGLDLRQREAIDRICDASGSALGLVDDLLDLSLAAAGNLRLHAEPIDVPDEVRKVVDSHRPAMRAAGLEVSLDLSADVPAARADRRRMRQVLDNLLSNATKYTQEGGRIQVATRAEPDEHRGNGGWLAIDVTDTGPGIPQDKQEEVFREFSRLEPGTERGTGLGLAISRKIARAMGGDVVLQSVPGEGSTFSLRLPVDSAGEASGNAAA
jgi:signal transduction histidine kinase